MTDPSRREAAEAGERQEEVETAEDEHTVAPEPADPNSGLVRARPPTAAAWFIAAATATATLIVLVAAALAG